MCHDSSNYLQKGSKQFNTFFYLQSNKQQVLIHSGCCIWALSVLNTKCGAMLLSTFSTNWVLVHFFFFLDFYTEAVINSQILTYTQHRKKGFHCVWNLAVVQLVLLWHSAFLQQPFLKLTQNKEGLRPPPV